MHTECYICVYQTQHKEIYTADHLLRFCLCTQILHDLNTFVYTRYRNAIRVNTSRTLAVSASYTLSEI